MKYNTKRGVPQPPFEISVACHYTYGWACQATSRINDVVADVEHVKKVVEAVNGKTYEVMAEIQHIKDRLDIIEHRCKKK